MKLFITGTDTDIGKTYISIGLLKTFAKQGKTTLGMKPIASGCTQTKQGLRNEDAVALQQASTVKLNYEQINPFAFETPIAPHLAAAKEGAEINLNQLAQACQEFLQQPADVHIIEGAGGWRVPLNQHETWSDLIKLLPVKIILVVGMRLGCINHALLTYEAIKKDGCNIIAWIANCIDPQMPALKENIQTLKDKLPIPLLEVVPYEAENPST